MENHRKWAFRIAGVIIIVMITTLLVWPERMPSWAMILGLIASALGAFGISGEKQQ